MGILHWVSCGYVCPVQVGHAGDSGVPLLKYNGIDTYPRSFATVSSTAESSRARRA